MPKSKTRQKILAEKRVRKANEMKSKGTSSYARKRKYLDRVHKFGFESIDKPWKSQKASA